METLKNLLDKLYEKSKTRNKENKAIQDFESISYEVGIQSTIRDIQNWLEDNKFSWEVNDSHHISLVRVE